MAHKQKSILFLSALDFKEKSIQVIRKTPEAYISAGWDVHYIVVRDNSIYDNYYYENEINIPGLNLQRHYLPMQSKINKYGKNRVIRRLLQKTAYLFAIIKLFRAATKLLKEKNIEVIYGYEIHGVLAVNLLKLFRKIKGQKIVSRFQGTFGSYYYYNSLYLKMIASVDHYLAMYLPSDLCIMTDDGTQGDKALELINSKSLKNFRFWVNGVDEQKLHEETVQNLRVQMNPENKLIFLTICRLEHWKRVDRAIMVLGYLKENYKIKNFQYIVVGEGVEKDNLIKLAKEQNLEANITFTGAIPNTEVKSYLNVADIYISTYDTSNVGNPLLEAIRSNKIIFTLNNGDTRNWIEHKENGFIYDITDNLFSEMATDIDYLIKNESFREKIIRNIRATEQNKLWSWKERMDEEVAETSKLIA